MSPSAVDACFLLGLGGDASRLLKRDVGLGEPYIQGEPAWERVNLKTGSGNGFSSRIAHVHGSESFGVFARSHGHQSGVWSGPNGWSLCPVLCGAGFKREGDQLGAHEALQRDL